MGKGWLKFDLTVEEAESLLRTEYKIYAHKDSGNERVACDEYSVPSHLKQHIDFITPTVHMDAFVKPKKKKRSLESRTLKPVSDVKQGITLDVGTSPSTNVAPQPATTFNLANCNTYITPGKSPWDHCVTIYLTPSRLSTSTLPILKWYSVQVKLRHC